MAWQAIEPLEVTLLGEEAIRDLLEDIASLLNSLLHRNTITALARTLDLERSCIRMTLKLGRRFSKPKNAYRIVPGTKEQH